MKSLKNKFIMAPIKLGYAANGFVNDRHLIFYEKRSHNMGTITIEPLYLDKGLREIPHNWGSMRIIKYPGLQALFTSCIKTELK